MNLTELALKHGSDKAGHHNYTPIYEKYFAPFREQPITLLELGIGGYEYPDRGGASLKMWYEYFPKASIIGIDLYQKNNLVNDRIKIGIGSQVDSEFLKKIIHNEGRPNIIVDDASHINNLTIQSFIILFPLLAPGGIYVVEDIESSWAPAGSWADGCSDPYNFNTKTTVNYFRALVNEMNAQYIPHFQSCWSDDLGIESIHFYKNIIFILKK
jgi:hypothetical protein